MPELTEEQMEQLKNLPPEKLAELQKQNCPFCMIISEKIPSKKIYEDEICMAILDINPANPGHVLIIPKEHYAVMPQVPDETISRMSLVAKAISQKIFDSMNVGGTNVLIQNGEAADQRAPHFIMHVIPRMENDGINFGWQPKKLSEEDMDKVEAKLKEKPIMIEKPKPKPVEIKEEKQVVKEDSQMLKSIRRIP
jgi:histidine triad (HIT) family protein